MASSTASIVQRIKEHPGRGGCGVGAIADLAGRPSRALVDMALGGLACMEHRGGAIDDTGDGAGLLLSVDPLFFERFLVPGAHLPAGHQLSVGVRDVWVNGVRVLADGLHTDARPGRIVDGPGRRVR